MDSYIYKLYEFFYKKVIHFEDFKFNPSKKDISCLHNFFEEIDKRIGTSSLGKKWYFDFVAYQFQFYSQIKYSRSQGRVYFNFIFGKKAIERFFNKRDSWSYYLQLFFNKYDISFEQVSKVYYKRNLIDSSYEDRVRRSVEGEERFSNCIMNTTLFNQFSEVCKSCNINQECKSVLKELYPLIYKQREKKSIEKGFVEETTKK